MKNNKLIGFHIPAKYGLSNTVLIANKLKIKVFSLFITSTSLFSKYLNIKEINKFRDNCKKYHYSSDQILVHSSYLINLGHPTINGINKSRYLFFNELYKCEQLGLKLINFHLGNHLHKINITTSLIRIAKSINLALDKFNNIILIMENSAGQGSSIGSNFEHLSNIISMINNKNRIGVCLDTCHAFAAGYDLSNNYCKVFDEFNNIIGLKYLKAIHLNDSKNKCNSRIDRHASLGQGMIGNKMFKWIMLNNELNKIPIIIETPKENWINEINWLNNLIY
ncbi:MAG: deoxyribonuclease IV [Candidatus Lightella neohaematopini]|nr:deoxyribonuclease IV [Candidatus Lightella neohaematopini]